MSHARDFGSESGNAKLAEQLIWDYRQADLSPRDRALCDYAIKLTQTPGAVSETDIILLREHGWTDEQIHLAAQVIGYFNYINRVADGLGVDLEPWMTLRIADWKKRKQSVRS